MKLGTQCFNQTRRSTTTTKKIEIKNQKSQNTKIQYLIRRIQQSFKTRLNHRKERIRTTEIIQSEKQKIEESLQELWDTIEGTMLAL